jgi:hypothetical protein
MCLYNYHKLHKILKVIFHVTICMYIGVSFVQIIMQSFLLQYALLRCASMAVFNYASLSRERQINSLILQLVYI